MNEGLMSVPARIWRSLSARDPGRARLKTATAVSAGVLGSALFALGVVHVLHADSALLATAAFLSVQAGNVVKGPTSRARVVTAGLLVPAVLLAVSIAMLIPWRPAVIAVFIVLTGVAVWVRRFGPRAAAIGTMGFLAYFFTLFMHPTTAELPSYCLIAAGATTTQLIARVVLWATSRRPERELTVLLRELRVASAASLQAAASAAHARTLRARLARMDAIGRAITSWQHSFRTEEHTDCDEEALAGLVLDARVDTEEVCAELARAGAPTDSESAAVQEPSLTRLLAVLDERASRALLAEAASWAQQVVAGAPDSAEGALAYPVARSVLAHTRLRTIGLHRRQAMPALPDPAVPPVPARTDSGTRDGKKRWTPWREWTPTSRLAVQAMIAATIATAAGEAISASRWYWAVLTAFVIFLSTTTRSGILTRAYRRVAGTAIGILIGIGAAFLAHGDSGALIAICVVAIFGMIYFGPLNYMYSSLFMTIMLVAIYAMLGVLHGGILELRIAETVTGCVIGVLCAYLILSSNSHPALVAKVNAYFDALDELLRQASDPAASSGRSILTSVQTLEAAQADVDQTVSAMSTAFLIGRHDHEEAAIRLMYVSTRSAVRFAQVTMPLGQASAEAPPVQSAVRDAVAEVRAAAARVRRQMDGSAESADVAHEKLPALPAERLSDDSDETASLVALDRLDWALERLSEVVAPRLRAGG